jgi:hypothetical protein
MHFGSGGCNKAPVDRTKFLSFSPVVEGRRPPDAVVNVYVTIPILFIKSQETLHHKRFCISFASVHFPAMH